MVDEAAWQRVVAVVRRVEALNYDNSRDMRLVRQREGEVFLNGTASAACASTASCDCTPDNPASADDMPYTNAEGSVASGAVIQLIYEQRTGKMARAPWSIIDEFVLTEDLAHNGSGDATRTKCDGTAGDSYAIYDNGKIGSGYKFVTGDKLTAYYSTCGKWYWIAGPCRTAA